MLVISFPLSSDECVNVFLGRVIPSSSPIHCSGSLCAIPFISLPLYSHTCVYFRCNFSNEITAVNSRYKVQTYAPQSPFHKILGSDVNRTIEFKIT